MDAQKGLLKYLSYINNRYFVRLGIDSWRHLIDFLPGSAPTVVTVAGTNGKGSFVEVLSRALLDSGISYAAYTSPHIHDFKERLLVNGNMLSDNDWLEAFRWLESISNGVELSPFEFYTLSALFLAFKANVAILILEVGLGGRRDAVNVLAADYAIITEVDYDHTELLGNSLPEIAYQKAGIMRANKPAIFAGSNAVEVFQSYASEIGAELYVRGHDFDFVGCDFVSLDSRFALDLPISLALPSALAAIKLAELMPFPLVDSVIRAIESFGLPGRFEQLVWRGRNLVFDVAHNPASLANLSRNITRLGCSKVCLWLALPKLKLAKSCIECLSGIDYALVSSSDAEIFHSASYLSSLLSAASIEVLCNDLCYQDAAEYLDRLQTFDVIVIAGSFKHIALAKKTLGF